MSTTYTAVNLKWADLKQAAPQLGLTVEQNDKGEKALVDAEGNVLIVYGEEKAAGATTHLCFTRYTSCGNPTNMILAIEEYFGIRLVSDQEMQDHAHEEGLTLAELANRLRDEEMADEERQAAAEETQS